MILLEFKFKEVFREAFRVLDAAGLQFRSEKGREDYCPSYIYFFEDELRTEPQREALKRARDLEGEDHRREQRRPVPALGVPF
jgi:hypothetical protein